MRHTYAQSLFVISLNFKLGGVSYTFSGHLTPKLQLPAPENGVVYSSFKARSFLTEFTVEVVFIVLVSSLMHTLQKILQFCIVLIMV